MRQGASVPAIINNHLFRKEKERQSQNLGKSDTLSRDNKCGLPRLIGWLHARSARRNFCLTISGNSWMVNVSQYDINVCLPCVCAALCVYSGVLGRCGVVAFFLRLSFFVFSLSFFPLFSISVFFHFFMFFISSFFLYFLSFFLKSRAQAPVFSQSVNEN